MYIFIRMYGSVYIHTYKQTNKDTSSMAHASNKVPVLCKCICIHVRMYACLMCRPLCIVHMQVCMYVCMYVYAAVQ